MAPITRGQAIAVLRSMAAEYTATADTIRSMCPPEPSPYLRQLEERIAAIEYSLDVLAVRAPKRGGSA